MAFLNLVARVHDDRTEPLVCEQIDPNNAVEHIVPLGSSPQAEYRRLSLYISHKNDLVTFGYVNSNLVWFSLTKTDDMLSTRRIFDTVKVGTFYRKTSIDAVLPIVGMVPRDLHAMCNLNVNDTSKPFPQIFGCASMGLHDENAKLTGDEFSKFIAVLPNRLRERISGIGSFDVIMSALNKDFDTLEALYAPDEPYSEAKYKFATELCEKWRGVNCLNMSDRASLRSLYLSVCYHPASLRDLSAVGSVVKTTANAGE